MLHKFIFFCSLIIGVQLHYNKQTRKCFSVAKIPHTLSADLVWRLDIIAGNTQCSTRSEISFSPAVGPWLSFSTTWT